MRNPPSVLRLALASAGALLFSSCYATVQGARYLSLLSRAVPADRILADPDAKEASRELLLRARGIRSFAMERLGLRDTKNYTTLVETESDTLAFVVSACDAASFERHLWRYPVVGRLPYKGFFKPEEADREAARRRAQGLDVIFRPVEAFSTLGWFRDPLFSFMSKYDEAQLAETILHELAHATVFVKKAEQFNEEFATFIGREGALLYMEHLYGPGSPEADAVLRSRKDSEAFAAYLRGTATMLQAVYASDMDREEKLRRKEIILAQRAEEYRGAAASLFSEGAYAGFPMEKVNNAYLDLYRLYEGEPELYREFYEKICGRDLAVFIRSISELAEARGDPRERMRGLLQTDS